MDEKDPFKGWQILHGPTDETIEMLRPQKEVLDMLKTITDTNQLIAQSLCFRPMVVKSVEDK